MFDFIKKRGDQIEIGNWYIGWHSWKFEIVYQECGYERGNAELHISMLGWHSVFILPWKSKRFPNGDCDEPRWGIASHSQALWFYWGGEGNWPKSRKRYMTCWYYPFTYTKPSCRWQVECEVFPSYDICLIDREKMECKDNKNWKPIYEVGAVEIDGELYRLALYQYKYKDSYDGEIIPCVFWVEKQEWRPKWLGWCGLFKKTRRSISVEFEKEVGKEKGSWKGGVTGCGYTMLPNETPLDCIKRMEKERKL